MSQIDFNIKTLNKTILLIAVWICTLFVSQPNATELQKIKSDLKLHEQVNLWKSEVRNKIKNNWLSSPELEKTDKDLKVKILLSISESGHIEDIYISSNSNNKAISDAAIDAIKKSEPFPEIPVKEEQGILTLFFSPKGMIEYELQRK